MKSDAPLPPQIGPYRITRRIGAGGMGVVYEAHDPRTGEPVAVKTVRLLEASMLASIRREVYALQRLRHPGVVRIVDQGVDPYAGPWYAMERLRGESLRDRMAAWRATPSDERAALLGDVTTIFYAVCDALAFVHASGVVHRDLKPDNVHLDGDRAVLVDFGLSSQFGALDTVAYARSNGGTVKYLAPELLDGDEADARADLYALGCMLYESLAGVAPFDGGSRAEIAAQHRTAPPPPLAPRAPWVPATLERLVRHMLQKRPEHRVGHATDVARVLAASGARVSAPTQAPAVSPYLYRASLVGRAAAIERVASGTWRSPRRDGCAFVLGEAGVGKTRVLVDVASRLQRDRVRVIESGAEHRVADGNGERGAEPLGLFRPILAWLADQCREDPERYDDDVITPYGPLLARYEPSFRALCGGRIDAADDGSQARVVECLRRALEPCTVAGPLALVLDDLQWADELSLALVASLADDRLRPEGLTLVCAARPDAMPATLHALVEAPGACRVDLARLDRTEVATLLRGLLAMGEVPDELTEFVFARSDGNPFIAAEYVRSAIASGHVRRDADGRWFLADEGRAAGALQSGVRTPEPLADVVSARLASLSPDALRLLDTASVLGREFHPDVLLALTPMPDAQALEALDELRRRQVFEARRGGRLRFVHDLLRETVLRRIAPDVARALHRAAAEALEARDDTRDDAETVGTHWSLAGVDDRAAVALARAADRARDAYANRSAVRLYATARRHADALCADGSAAWRALAAALDERLGTMLERTGAHDDARDAYDRALARLDDDAHLDRARVLRLLAKTREASHRHDDARDAYDRAAHALDAAGEHVREARWWREHVELRVERVWLHYWRGEVEAMTALVDEARAEVLARGDGRQRARFHQAHVHNELRRLRYRIDANVVSVARDSLDAACTTTDRGAIAYARFILGFAQLFAGDADAAAATLADALAESEHIGDVVLALRCRTYLTVAHRARGDVDLAEPCARACLDAARAAKMPDYEGVARANLAWAAWRRRDARAVREHAVAADAVWRSIAARYVYPMQWLASLPALAVACDERDLATALAHAAALTGSEQHDLRGEVLPRLRAALAAHERGDDDAALDAVRSAVNAATRDHHI